jgi:pyruvate/2-oxoglutarate dehydrogenase complex dihydrolipoamide dehydrogenase (E3) component
VRLSPAGLLANTAGLGLETTNVVMRGNGSIQVDKYFATAEHSIYAIGDVIDRVQLTPVAIQEAMVLVDHLFGDSSATIDYRDIPTAVFCQPEFGTVGLNEEQAREEYKDIAIYVSDFKPMLQTLGGGTERITMKLVVDEESDIVLGCHMVGEHAAEIIQGMGIALKAGATKAHFDATVGIHPSAAEEFGKSNEMTASTDKIVKTFTLEVERFDPSLTHGSFGKHHWYETDRTHVCLCIKRETRRDKGVNLFCNKNPKNTFYVGNNY